MAGAFNVVWAFDPYSELKSSWNYTNKFLMSLAGTRDLKVKPVFVLGQEMTLNINNERSPDLQKLKPIIEKVMTSRLQGLRTRHFANPEVLVSSGVTLREDISVLNKFLNSTKPDLVVVNSHQRKGIKRLFLGSFAESFLLSCKTPVLVLPPGKNAFKPFKKALLPTSFSDNEKEFFKKLIGGVYGDVKQVVLYSKVFHPIDAFAQSATMALGGGWVSVEAFAKDQIGRRKKLSESWLSLAKEQGVKLEIVIEDSPKDFADSVKSISQKKSVNMVVMPSFAGAAETILLGSNAREVIRNSVIPVLIHHA